MVLLCAKSEKCLESAGPEGCKNFHDLLHEMDVCAREHFAKEEEFLLARHFPMLAEHAEEHEQFQTALSDFLFFAMQCKANRTESVCSVSCQNGMHSGSRFLPSNLRGGGNKFFWG